MEQAYQDTLGGSPRVADFQRDARGQPIPETATVVSPGTPGQDVRLTIDAGLQLAVEQELLAAYVADDAKSVSAIVMDPYTGEVYAEATYPSYDANDYRAIAAKHPERFIDPVVSSNYEPGSVFKMMTATAALEHKSVTLDTRIKDTGTLQLDGGRAHIDDADRKGMGWMTFQDGVAFSRNVVAAKVALDLAPVDPRLVGDPLRHVAEARLRRQDRHRPRQRGRPASSATRGSSRGPRSTSPTARSARAWRSRRSSSRRPTPR